MSGFSLAGFLEAERAGVETALSAVGDALGPGRLGDAIRYALEAGGKRLRPILCVAACRAVAGDTPAPVFRLAAALELIHTYSLVHDDLPSMDDDPVRRGRPATHVAHGVTTATVAGAAMIPLAVRVAAAAAAELGLARRGRSGIVVELCAAAGQEGMVAGQALDLEAERRPVALEELERIHRLKTGALLAASPRIGGLAAEADDLELAALDTFGRALGLAFQITDDILDVTGDADVLGKAAGRDTRLEKATYPGLAGLDEARARARREADVARAALAAAGIDSEELDALAAYAVERDR
ncbi:MAG TPA: farnesyl diphosphate synthase [Longimicrobiales bacterium]|nr:farnesyl diphosphate synthase [Longimicrobiales bacterium]